MKKILLTLAITFLVMDSWAQSQLTTVRGKTKDGKTIKVEYYQGSVEDYVESVRYQLVDELQAKVTELQAKLDAANKQVKDLKAGNQGGDKEKQISELYGQIDVLNSTIKRLNRQLSEKNISYDSLSTINQGLQQQLADKDKVKPVVPVNNNDKDLKRLRDSIASKDATIRNLNNAIADCEKRVDDLEKDLVKYGSTPTGSPRPGKSPVVAVEAGFGPVFMRDEMEEGWSKDVRWAKMVDVYFGTARLSNSFPISVEVGAGIRSFGLSVEKAAATKTITATDADGDSYQAIYDFGVFNETLSLTYLDIPVRLCFGQPTKGIVGVYAKVGLTPSINVSSSFTGSGKYDLKGYYPQWDVTLEDVSELGFGSDMDWYSTDTQPDISRFILWGNLALGAYVPFDSAPVLLNGGVRLDIPFMGIGTAAEGMGLLGNGGKTIVPSIEFGLVYTIK